MSKKLSDPDKTLVLAALSFKITSLEADIADFHDDDIEPRPWHKAAIEGLSRTVRSYRGTRARVKRAWGIDDG